jgi:cytidylate kinase
MVERRLVITIDGPAGAGKSTAAKAVAQRLGYTLLDTGAIYRAVALLAREQGIAWSDAPTLAVLARDLDIGFDFDGLVNRVQVGGRDISADIRRPEMADGASQVSALPEVRAALLDLQRRLARAGGVVAEGRDTGTVVFPSADLKVFLTATAEARARRRYEEERAKGLSVDFAATLAELQARDQRDERRAAAPLKQADDAVLLDSTALSLDQVVDRLLAEVARRGH